MRTTPTAYYRALVIGEQPHPLEPHAKALAGRSATVLCQLAGLEYDRRHVRMVVDGHYSDAATACLHDAYAVVNLLAAGQDWRAADARVSARMLLMATRPRVVVCLGRRVQAAVGGALGLTLVRSGPQVWGGLFGNWGAWVPPWLIRAPGYDNVPPPWVVSLPHPSGRNRTLNNQAARDLMGRVLIQARDLALHPNVHPDHKGDPA